ncbi:MAG: glycosyltransferase family 2 protein [Thermodesulfobacteriota bacterium]
MVPDWLIWIAVCIVAVVVIEVFRAGKLLFRNLRTEPRLETQNPPGNEGPYPLVSVIIPAKDEEGFIERTMRSVLGSDYPNLELIVVNDRSEDRTGRIVSELAGSDPRVKALHIEELPDGWTGKTHALFRGTELARGDIFLFTDADTILRTDVISLAVNYFAKHNVDMLGLLPGFIQRGFSENVVYWHLALGLSFFYPLTDVNDPGKSAGLASGSFIMISREAYRTVGTWERLKNEITEDVALGKLVKARGLKLTVARGPDLVSTRGFASVPAVFRFWKRTFYGGLEKSVRKTLRLTVNYTTLNLLPICLVGSVAALVMGDNRPCLWLLFILSACGMALVIAPYSYFLHKEHAHWAYGLTAPLGIALSAWVALGTLLTLLGNEGIRWRGSTYR